VAFGTGQVCSQCSPACDIGQVLTAPCTSTADIACEAVIASEVLPEIDYATLTYSNEQSYPTTATYACGDNEMGRTLQPDGTWSVAGELSCGPTWILGAAGESCDTVCAAEGLPCTDGEWGVVNQASLEAALEAAGQSSSDRASMCSAPPGASWTGGYYGDSWEGRPTVHLPHGVCEWMTEDPSRSRFGVTSCSATSSNIRRLCRCEPPPPPPPWILGALGQNCNTVCTAEGLPCTDGQWGVNDQASLVAALEAAGQSSSDQASLCSGGYLADSWSGDPLVMAIADNPEFTGNYCRWQTGATTLCSAWTSDTRRLCRCA
jgi:hypothetical protein